MNLKTEVLGYVVMTTDKPRDFIDGEEIIPGYKTRVFALDEEGILTDYTELYSKECLFVYTARENHEEVVEKIKAGRLRLGVKKCF